MTIVDKIKKSIEDATSLPCYYHDEATLNMEADAAQYPCAMFYIVESGDVQNVSGQLKERVNAYVYFCNLTEFDFDAEANEEVIEGCKDDAFAWLGNASTDENISIVNINRTARLYKKFDAITTGFALDLTIEELNGTCY